jgi:hypothetical protein
MLNMTRRNEREVLSLLANQGTSLNSMKIIEFNEFTGRAVEI